MLLLGLMSTFTSTCLMGYLKFGKKKCFLKSHVYLSLYCNYNCSWMTFFIIHLTSVDTEMCCPKGKCGCQYFILLTLKKKIMDTGSWIFFNKKLILDYYFLLKIRFCVFISNFHHNPESVCFKSVIQSGLSLFLSKIKIHR